MKKYFILFVLLIINHKIINAQDARVSDFSTIPLITNPANTGNFDGTIRAIGYYTKMSDLTLSNNLFNLNADYRFSKNKLGLGINYMKTGSSNFNMSGNYLGLSTAKYLYLGKQKNHKVMFGMQLSYLSGEYDGLKKGYNPYLDVRAFANTILNLSNSIDSNYFSKNQVNFNVGFGYTFISEKVRLDFDVAGYNLITKYLRQRLSACWSFTYSLDKINDIKFKQIYWQEGFFIPRSKVSSDSIRIKDIFFNVEWQRKNKFFSSLGLQTCGLKSYAAIVGIKFNSSLSSRINYEIPFEKNKYNPSKFGLSMVCIIQGKKHQEAHTVSNHVHANNMPDTLKVSNNIAQQSFEADSNRVVAEKNRKYNEPKKITTIEDSLISEIKKLYEKIDATIKSKVDTVYLYKEDSARIYFDNELSPANHPNDLKLKINDKREGHDVDAGLSGEARVKDSLYQQFLQHSLNGIHKNEAQAETGDYETAIYFSLNKHELTYDAMAVINKMIANKNITMGNKVFIKSYCDDLGTDSWNSILSQYRAENVRKYLISKGIRSGDISVMSLGKSKFPILESEKSKFRKVVILVKH